MCIRDSLLTLRVQLLALPVGDKKKFDSEMKAACQHRIDVEQAKSRIGLSYYKAIRLKFEEDAFLSNTKASVSRGGKPRPKRSRRKKNPSQRAAAGRIRRASFGDFRAPPGLITIDIDERPSGFMFSPLALGFG